MIIYGSDDLIFQKKLGSGFYRKNKYKKASTINIEFLTLTFQPLYLDHCCIQLSNLILQFHSLLLIISVVHSPSVLLIKNIWFYYHNISDVNHIIPDSLIIFSTPIKPSSTFSFTSILHIFPSFFIISLFVSYPFFFSVASTFTPSLTSFHWTGLGSD